MDSDGKIIAQASCFANHKEKLPIKNGLTTEITGTSMKIAKQHAKKRNK